MMKTWNRATLEIDWTADRHSESHGITYQRPTESEPAPERPIVVGQPLSARSLPMSSEWGKLFPSVVVKDFDEHSLTLQYGERIVVLTTEHNWEKLGMGGMSYTTFALYVRIECEPEKEEEKKEPEPFVVSHDETFLRRFRTKLRIVKIDKSDIEQIKELAGQGDVYAKYAYGRWLYFNNPTDTSMQEAEELFLAAESHIPDALAAYASMWYYGETKENVMDIDRYDKLEEEAIRRGSERAMLNYARRRIYGQYCEAQPGIVAKEIEKRLSTTDDPDPQWYTYLGYAYEEMQRKNDAVIQYAKAVERGEVESYFYIYVHYLERGNLTLAEEYIEEGIEEGDGLCCYYQSDMDEDRFLKLSKEEQDEMHRVIDERLQLGVERWNGYCAYLLFMNYYYGGLGYTIDRDCALYYLKQGVGWGELSCIRKMAELAEEGSWPEPLTKTEIGELWLRACRYSHDDEDCLKGLSRVDDPAFLLKHKEELERYWMPLFPRLKPARPPKTPIDPMVIIIWPSGHLDIEKADVYKMKTYREMGETLIGADRLDAVHYSPLLEKIAKAAELDLSLVMYCDRDARMKGLNDNAIGTILYGHGGEILGPIIICQEDRVCDCHSFKTLEDLTATYNEINRHCGGLLIIKDEDDGRYDAYV